MDGKTIALIWLATCITILEIVAIVYDVNGQMFATSISAIVGLFGFAFGREVQRVKDKTLKDYKP